ncbi:Acetyl-coenzyme A transferase nodX [Psilocybe cubensis]|uniref:Uncharacterized protein n=2 Tax=Psilocybe cubensis TaxID=181762 RepID=A0A8H7XYB4_PSICU|nr:Acetyl-coenzyme A transferase nodX [Psilocybe cubensis]KAH9478543.1 Acetyl-coenzyme A transferase nodX [Psilocybe cubensis]
MESYSVPAESLKLLHEGIIQNPLHAFLPTEIKEASKYIEFIGTDDPSIPINWRFAESISSIKGFQASMLNVLLKKKYGVDYQRVVINTDHAQLFIMSQFLPVIDPLGEKISPRDLEYRKYFPDGDIYKGMDGTPLIAAATNIYKTKDGRFYHVHTSMNAGPVERALKVFPEEEKVTDFAGGCAVYQEKVSKLTAEELDTLMNDKYRQAGTICWSTEEYLNSEHGKANAHVGLYELHHIPNPKQAPGWWTPVDGRTYPSRPLYGLKVLELARIIAAPTVTRDLAELGASVMRITSPDVSDLTVLLCDLAWGKWNAHLDLTKPEDRSRLKALIEESDVIVDGYRPGAMEKWGFGKNDILELFKGKERGIIYLRENCYGWNGPWAYRSGWQQISDACCGVSLEYGRAMGNDEPVTPGFPNSDCSTGVSGATAVLQALIEKSEKGGSFVIDAALNYYSQWLVNSCSTYPSEVWKKTWASYGNPVFRNTDNMVIVTLPSYLRMLQEHKAAVMNPDFFETRENRALGVPVKTVKPILTFPEGMVKPGYNIGSRGNGVDQPIWPEDLAEEVVGRY